MSLINAQECSLHKGNCWNCYEITIPGLILMHSTLLIPTLAKRSSRKNGGNPNK